MLSQIADFVNWVRRRNPEARTWRDYSYDLQQFVAILGDRSPGEVSFRDIDRFVNSQVSRGFQPATINRRLAAILAFFTYLADEHPSLVCPVLPRRHFLRQPQRLPRPVQESDLRLFFAVIEDARDKAMFILMLRCGLRLGELEELRLEDLDLAGRKLSVRNGKGMKDRTVYLTDTTAHALSAYLSVRGVGPSDHVFLYRNEALKKDLARSRIKDAGKRVGVKVYPHRLRHTTATQLLNAGCPVTSIQKFLGHKKLNTTMVYARAHDHTVEADYFAAMKRVEQHLELAGRTAEPLQFVGPSERGQLRALAEQLFMPELSFEMRLEIAEQMRWLLDGSQTAPMDWIPPPLVIISA